MTDTAREQETIEWLERLKSALDQREETDVLFRRTRVRKTKGRVLRAILKRQELSKISIRNSLNLYRDNDKRQIVVYFRFPYKKLKMQEINKRKFEKTLRYFTDQINKGEIEIPPFVNQRNFGDQPFSVEYRKNGYIRRVEKEKSENFSLVRRFPEGEKETEEDQFNWLIETGFAMTAILDRLAETKTDKFNLPS